jgi:hypothetical protein
MKTEISLPPMVPYPQETLYYCSSLFLIKGPSKKYHKNESTIKKTKKADMKEIHVSFSILLFRSYLLYIEATVRS